MWKKNVDHPNFEPVSICLVTKHYAKWANYQMGMTSLEFISNNLLSFLG